MIELIVSHAQDITYFIFDVKSIYTLNTPIMQKHKKYLCLTYNKDTIK